MSAYFLTLPPPGPDIDFDTGYRRGVATLHLLSVAMRKLVPTEAKVGGEVATTSTAQGDSRHASAVIPGAHLCPARGRAGKRFGIGVAQPIEEQHQIAVAQLQGARLVADVDRLELLKEQ